MNFAVDRPPLQVSLEEMAAIADRVRKSRPVVRVVMAFDVFERIRRSPDSRANELLSGPTVHVCSWMAPGSWRVFRLDENGKEYPAEGWPNAKENPS